MGDLALVWQADLGSADLAVRDDDLAADDGLRTAVLLSLFTDRRAEADDKLPSGDGDRRGWWADQFMADPIGSRLWLLDRSKSLPEVVRDAEAYASEALAWFVEDGVADRVDVFAEAQGDLLALAVAIHRPTGAPASFRFNLHWAAETGRAAS